MELEKIIPHLNEKIKSTIEHYINELKKVRTGRAHTSFLEHVVVDYYGVNTPISQVAVLSLADSQTLTVKPYEKKMLPEVEKAIVHANLGVNTFTQNDTILISMPILTQERRHNLVKQIKKLAEESKVAIRNIRRDSNHDSERLLQDKAISEDDNKKMQSQIQNIVDKSVAEIDSLTKAKEQDLMTI